MKNLNFLIKPSSSLCNMRCRYCFYADIAENREVASMGLMNEQTMQELVTAAFNAIDSDGFISFAFQGGEPTVSGLDYFKSFVAYVNSLRTGNIKIIYSLQTNGLMIDGEWAEFLKENNFLVGVSVDGGSELHDYFRLDAKGKGTYSRVSKAFKLLQKYKVDVNALCVVTEQCAKRPVKTYTALKKLGADFIQFIPCLDALQKERGSDGYSLLPETYESFLCGLFDAWYSDWEKGQYKSIRLFDDYIHLAMGLNPGTCATSGACGSYFVVEGDGSLYPCDFYVLDEWKIGNVKQADLKMLSQSKLAAEFITNSSQKPPECTLCTFKPLCKGGCKRDWVYESGVPHNYYCKAFTKFFEYAGERIAHIAKLERRVMAGKL